jgi:hypothetical protein
MKEEAKRGVYYLKKVITNYNLNLCTLSFFFGSKSIVRNGGFSFYAR